MVRDMAFFLLLKYFLVSFLCGSIRLPAVSMGVWLFLYVHTYLGTYIYTYVRKEGVCRILYILILGLADGLHWIGLYSRSTTAFPNFATCLPFHSFLVYALG